MSSRLKIFSGSRSKGLTREVCHYLEIEEGKCEVGTHPDGECFVRINEDVRGRDCFVVLSTCEPVNDNLIELCCFMDCLRRSSAKHIIAVIPYFGYARQDRKDEGRVPITAKMVSNLIVAAGAHRVLSIDLHAAQIQGFFDIPVDHLSATEVFLDYFESRRDELEDLCLVSPDVGNVKVAEKIANLLRGDLAIINKIRDNGTVRASRIIGDVSAKTVLMFDDMISTAGTMCKAANLVKENGARRVIAAATHPVLAGSAVVNILDSYIDEVICTNTIERNHVWWQSCDNRASMLYRYKELSVAPLLGEAIHRIYNNKSVSDLFRRTAGCKR